MLDELIENRQGVIAMAWRAASRTESSSGGRGVLVMAYRLQGLTMSSNFSASASTGVHLRELRRIPRPARPEPPAVIRGVPTSASPRSGRPPPSLAVLEAVHGALPTDRLGVGADVLDEPPEAGPGLVQGRPVAVLRREAVR